MLKTYLILIGILVIHIVVSGCIEETGPIGSIQAATIVVTPGQSIQSAINVARPGDVIGVQNGTYYENVVIDKKVTLRAMGNPVVDAGGNYSAISLETTGIILEGFTVINADEAGILVSPFSHNNTIEGNTARECKIGIEFETFGMAELPPELWAASRNNVVTGNAATNNSEIGIDVFGSNDTLVGNIASNNGEKGIKIFGSNNTLIGNIISNNMVEGLNLEGRNYTLRNNSISGSRFNLDYYGYGVQDIDTSNLVDGRQIHYLLGISGVVISNAGMVFCIDCDNITVKDSVLKNNSYAVIFDNTTRSIIENNYITNNRYSIRQFSGSNNTISGNVIVDNSRGLEIIGSGNIIAGNNVIHSSDGIRLVGSENVITGNTFHNNGFGVGKYFWGGIHIYGSNNKIADNNVSHNGIGIELSSFSDSNTITGNMISDNELSGIELSYSHNNTIANNIFRNNKAGITLQNSSNNILYEDYILDNIINAFDDGRNHWDNGMVGNYYGGFNCTDSDGNDICDEEHKIPGGSSVDRYPLTKQSSGGHESY